MNSHVRSATNPGLNQDQINTALDKARAHLDGHRELLRLFNEVHQHLTPQIVARARKSQEDMVRRQETENGSGC